MHEIGENEIKDAVEKSIIQKPYESDNIEEAEVKSITNKMPPNEKSIEEHSEEQLSTTDDKYFIVINKMIREL